MGHSEAVLVSQVILPYYLLSTVGPQLFTDIDTCLSAASSLSFCVSSDMSSLPTLYDLLLFSIAEHYSFYCPLLSLLFNFCQSDTYLFCLLGKKGNKETMPLLSLSCEAVKSLLIVCMKTRTAIGDKEQHSRRAHCRKLEEIFKYPLTAKPAPYFNSILRVTMQ